MGLKNQISSMIRVDHAGEYGAKVIYAGQIAALKLRNKDQEAIKLIEHMKMQEDKHFDYFDQEIIKRKIRPTIMQPLWKVAGFGLGFVTAILDKRAAMACTVAVEEVIDEHYQKQINQLKDNKCEDKELVEKITQFRKEEIEHRDIGYDHHAADLSYYQPLTKTIRAFSKLAIFISTRI